MNSTPPVSSIFCLSTWNVVVVNYCFYLDEEKQIVIGSLWDKSLSLLLWSWPVSPKSIEIFSISFPSKKRRLNILLNLQGFLPFSILNISFILYVIFHEIVYVKKTPIAYNKNHNRKTTEFANYSHINNRYPTVIHDEQKKRRRDTNFLYIFFCHFFSRICTNT